METYLMSPFCLRRDIIFLNIVGKSNKATKVNEFGIKLQLLTRYIIHNM